MVALVDGVSPAPGCAYVVRALAARGVPQAALDVQWFGESRPRIATPDGMPAPQSRRAEIVFGERPAA